MNEKRAVKVINRLDELNLTYKDFADAVGVTERAVYRWFNYEREPKLPLDQVAKMCSALQWSIQELASAYKSGESSSAGEYSK